MKITPLTRTYEKQYTFGTLVTSMEEYTAMKNSFIERGFTEDDCEYLYIDNIDQNSMCGFQGLNEVLIQAKGKYIILLHQDILAVDNRNVLEQRIKEITNLDPNWAILGTAGAYDIGKFSLYGSSMQGELVDHGPKPMKVFSLDEVFMLIKKDAGLSFSHDLTGFHYYGVDIGTIADILGYSCYTMRFNFMHRGSHTGRRFDFFECQNRMMRKYKYALRDRHIQVPCNYIYLKGENTEFIDKSCKTCYINIKNDQENNI